MLDDTDPADRFQYTQTLQYGKVHRQQRLANMKPGMVFLFQQGYLPTLLCQQGRYR